MAFLKNSSNKNRKRSAQGVRDYWKNRKYKKKQPIFYCQRCGQPSNDLTEILFKPELSNETIRVCPRCKKRSA